MSNKSAGQKKISATFAIPAAHAKAQDSSTARRQKATPESVAAQCG